MCRTTLPKVPNWNYSPPLRKFVDKLPLLGRDTMTPTTGQYLPVAVPDKNAYPGLNPGDKSDYYEIAVVQYQEQLHSDLPPTTLRGYVQIDTPSIPNTPARFALTYPDGSPILDAGGSQVYAVDKPHYLGPVIVAQRDLPVRIKVYNYLPKGPAGDLFIPVDPSVMGAGMGPHMVMAHQAMAMGMMATIMTMAPHGLQAGDKVMLEGFQPNAYNGYFTVESVPSPMQLVVKLKSSPGGNAIVLGEVMEMYTENRAVLHLHGGRTPWISDGTPHQWITPAGEQTAYPQGVSVKPVPDMPDTGNPSDGVQTYYYTNQQSARLMFYHDHVYGITRLNVYAGEAAGYMIRDDVETELVAGGFIPAEEIPLILQDKTFVDAATIGDLDPTWRWGTGDDSNGNGYRDYKTGDLWVPHVYMPAQNPYDISGMAAMGRWHYGPWFWPPTTGIGHPPIDNPYYDPVNRPWQPPQIPDVPDPSMGMEAFNDTPLVNGTAYPTLTVDPKAYRLRILNAANDRFFNLQLYEADPTTVSADGRTRTEVKMVPAVPNPDDPTWPADFELGNPTWPIDGRDGGVPDWNTRGPEWVQIGTEGGFLPMPVVIDQRPVDWNVDVTTFNAGIVNSKSLLLGCAERADVIVDFSDYAGKTLILYNDAPAAFPAPDARYDYFTGMPDMTDTGGRYPTDVGFGPNTRTVMQIKVNPDPVTDTWLGLDAMEAKWESTGTQDGVFKRDQDPIVVAQGELVPGYDQYNKAYNSTFPSTWPNWGISRIHDTSLRFQALDGSIVTIPMQPKAIQDEMGETFDDHGRMSGKLGLQLPSPQAGGQTFVLQSYVDPSTEVLQASMTPLTPPLAADGTQIWKITHNGVDTHPIHFHLFDVQLINRVGWDNGVTLPDANELGWKDTVRVSPLEDTIVALRPVAPALPFKLPDSVRLLDPIMPEGYTWQSFDPFTADPVTITNSMHNFGWEYMWHCHILSHEEMEMMRPVEFHVSPTAPSGLTAVLNGSVNLAWVNNATTPAATNLVLQRATDANFTTGVTTFNIANPAATTRSDSPGGVGTTYYYRIRAENELAYSVWSNLASVTTPDVVPANMNLVTYWNDAAVKTLKTAGVTMAASRDLAMVHGAIYDSVHSITGNGIQYRMTVPGASGASPEAAVAAAAYRVLAAMFPAQLSMLDVKLTASLDTVADGQAKTDGIAVGQTVADAMLMWRSMDHSMDMAMYMGGTNPGDWRPTPPAYALGAMPLWGTVTPFAMTSGSQFRIAPPPALDSLEYAQDLNETKSIGMMGSPIRTAEQTLIASFWEDRPGSFITVERWNAIALKEGITRSNTLEQDATLFAVLNIALADAQISTWDSKYLYSRWRPITAIREAAADGNPLTVADPMWTPLLMTPAHPEYASAHSTVGSAGAEVLQRFFLVDSANISLAAADNPAYVRNYTTYSQVVEEAGMSRIYGGIHFRFSKVAAEAAGRTLGAYVYDSITSPTPQAPTSLTATLATATRVGLAWADNSNNETGFTIQRATNAAFTTGLATYTVVANVTTYNATVVANTTYYFRVRATNADGPSLWSNVASIRTGPPAAPTALSAALSAQAPLTVGLTWTDNANNETGFTIQRATNAAFTSGLTTFPVGANVTAYTDTTALANRTYYFRVRATNVAGSSAWSNVVTIVTATPSTPSGLTAIASPLGSNPMTVTLAWNDTSTNEAGFAVQRATNSGFTQNVVAFTTAANVNGLLDSPVTTGTTYYYRVQGFNVAGASAWSATATITPGQPPMAAPTNLTVVSTLQTSISLRWTDNSATEQGFYVQRSTAGANGPWSIVATRPANATATATYTNAGLARTTTYWYRVQAFGATGPTAFTNVVSGTTR